MKPNNYGFLPVLICLAFVFVVELLIELAKIAFR